MMPKVPERNSPLKGKTTSGGMPMDQCTYITHQHTGRDNMSEPEEEDKVLLNSFSVDRERWGENKGMYECKASFNTKGMDFSIMLSPELGDALVAVCKGKIAAASAVALEHLVMLAKEDK
jgi:hypothetical protein